MTTEITLVENSKIRNLRSWRALSFFVAISLAVVSSLALGTPKSDATSNPLKSLALVPAGFKAAAPNPAFTAGPACNINVLLLLDRSFSVSATDEAKLLEGLGKLAKISTIQLSHIGRPARTSGEDIEKGYSVSWLCFFKNLIEEEIYQTDPIHLRFLEDYAHLWEKRVVYDALGKKG